MIIEEQFHKNLYRPYYIGYKPDKKISFPNMRFLTTNPLYAYFYSNKEGVIKEYRLKQNLNIFNARSKSDFNKLHKYIIDNQLNYNYDTLENLKSKDWVNVLEGDDKRQELLDILIILGFDGFFNFEYDDEMRKKLRSIYPEWDLPKSESSPAIGIFNSLEDCFIEVYTYTKKDFLTLPKFQEFRDSEIILLKTSFQRLQKHLGKSQTISILRNQDWIILTSEEVDSLLEDLSNSTHKPLPEWLKKRMSLKQ